MTLHDGSNKPPPPPGVPTIAQRVKAIQLAARSHSSEQNNKVCSPGSGAVKLVLPPRPPQPSSKSKIPETIEFKVRMDDQCEKATNLNDIKVNSRPRFMRGNKITNNMYPTKKDLDKKKPKADS